ncbi:hypothetical protein C8R44DRAFT_877015 [Mycena epipterygia]|nr:hypothetical protein C8R44DRAFT_877015 [Mycena epipterygia]
MPSEFTSATPEPELDITITLTRNNEGDKKQVISYKVAGREGSFTLDLPLTIPWGVDHKDYSAWVNLSGVWQKIRISFTEEAGTWPALTETVLTAEIWVEGEYDTLIAEMVRNSRNVAVLLNQNRWEIQTNVGCAEDHYVNKILLRNPLSGGWDARFEWLKGEQIVMRVGIVERFKKGWRLFAMAAIAFEAMTDPQFNPHIIRSINDTFPGLA